jgi:hypothetical protein
MIHLSYAKLRRSITVQAVEEYELIFSPAICNMDTEILLYLAELTRVCRIRERERRLLTVSHRLCVP